MLDLNEIYFFVEVVRAGSFAGAARRLGVPSTTVSRHVQQLEDALKNRLILRTTRKLTLTAVGQVFYEQCAQNIEQLMLARQEAADTHPQPVGPVRVALTPDFFEAFPISWITDFLGAYPGITLELVIDNPDLDLTSSGVDVAFRPESQLDEDSTRRVLGTSRRRLVAASKYIECHGIPKCPDELAQHACLLFSQHSGPVTWHLYGPDGHVQVEIRGRFLASTANLVRQAAIEGLGIALLAELLVNQEIEAGRLTAVLDEYRSDESKFCAVFPSHRHIRRVARVFVEHIRNKLMTIQNE
jgi:DNA-binding transcriptional LysR family regulator